VRTTRPAVLALGTDERRDVIRVALVGAELDARLAREDWSGPLAALDELRALDEQGRRQPEAVRLTCVQHRLRVEQALDPRRGPELLVAFAALPGMHAVEGTWSRTWELRLELMRWQVAADRGDLDAADAAARAALALARALGGRADLRWALSLSESLTSARREELHALAADVLLTRLDECLCAAEELPELTEASDGD